MVKYDKPVYASKKFIAFFFSLLLLGGILITALITQTFTFAMSVFMSVGILAVAFIAVGYVLGQTSLDKFVRGLEATKGGETKDEADTEQSVEEVQGP